MRKELNRSKDFGTVCGSGPNHRFEQDELLFDGQGLEVDKGGNPVIHPDPPPKPRPEPPPLPVSEPEPEVEPPFSADGPLTPYNEGSTKAELRKVLDSMGVKYSRKHTKGWLIRLINIEVEKQAQESEDYE